MKNFLYLCFVLLSTSLNAQWETLTPDATANAGVILRNESTANAKLLIGVSSCSVVLRHMLQQMMQYMV